MPRPRTWSRSSMTTALVVVDPRSMPMNVFTRRPLLFDHLEVALQAVLDVRPGEVARVHQVGLDERRRLAGALLDLAQDEQLSGREAVAALDRVDEQPVGLVLVHVLADHVDALREVEVRVAAQAVVGERLERM